MRNAESEARSKSPSGFFYSALSPLLIALLFTLSGCKGENQPSPPELPANVINLSNTEALSIAPDSAASGETLYIVWQEHVGGQNMEVFLSRSGDGGATFGAPVNVSQTSVFSGNPQIAASGNFVHVVWEETVPTNVEANEFDIFYRRGEDVNGTFTWSPPLSETGLRLSSPTPNCRNNTDTPGDDPCPSQLPTVVASGENVFVAWGESTIYQFEIDNSLNPPSKTFRIINSEILLRRSTDDGTTFDPTIFTISGPKDDSTLSPSFAPTLAATADRVYIAWEDVPLPQPPQPQSKIFFRTLIDPLSSAFSPPLAQQARDLSRFIKGSSRPSLAAEGTRVYLAWEGLHLPAGPCPAVQDNTPAPPEARSEIFLVLSENRGDQFSDANDCAQSNFSNTTGNSNSPRISVSGSSVYVVWMESTPDLAGMAFRKSEDGGDTFSAFSNIETAGSAANPSIIAAADGTLLASWEDATLGNLEIVFARE
ncbi:hypothetical protein [Candidatus Manganitrophus noduliformans]|uniref:Exo-alpha-sialidase n=1 Tax=Candidatus Manganitrophus noduliformans TaxID=2606439 RepID=A0A7X6IAD5_9BACT|nr:hypothetical protein [Candidatus Manganitrophus noduliformans]NKE70371.1 hypothetical protein [Candidatus Manganitrophus noduliformans]